MPALFTTDSRPGTPTSCAVAGHRLRRLRPARLQVRSRRSFSWLDHAARRSETPNARKYRRAGSVSSARLRGSRVRLTTIFSSRSASTASARVLQDGRETIIHPGEFALYDTTRPYELQFNDDFTQTIFQVPRAMLQRRIAGTENLTAISFTPDRPLQKLAYNFISSASPRSPTGSTRTARSACLIRRSTWWRWQSASGSSANALSSSTHRSALLCRLKAHVLRPSAGSRSLSRRDRRSARHLAALCQQTCLPTSRPRSSVTCWRSGSSIASATCHRRCLRIAMSAKSHSPGALTICRISAGSSASISACRRATWRQSRLPN